MEILRKRNTDVRCFYVTVARECPVVRERLRLIRSMNAGTQRLSERKTHAGPAFHCLGPYSIPLSCPALLELEESLFPLRRTSSLLRALLPLLLLMQPLWVCAVVQWELSKWKGWVMFFIIIKTHHYFQLSICLSIGALIRPLIHLSIHPSIHP